VAGRKERSMPWSYYDAAGKPVPEKAATFRCREVSVDGSAPAPPGHRSLGAIEYHDVHAIDQPELRKTFKSFSKMKAWFKQHTQTADISGSGRHFAFVPILLQKFVEAYDER
jgi:hypothetical protein